MQDSKTFGFDEDTYLACNPDVQRAVMSGQFASGFDHFMAFGRYEKRRGVTVDPTANDGDSPHPPEHLRFRVHGGRDLDGYLRLGQTISSDLNKLLSPGPINLPANARVLDFGSGPGRVATWLRQQHAEWQIFGTDIDAEAIDWARANLSKVANFECNMAMPPLRYADESFDFIYSISIFTHLPEEMQDAWLAELSRVTRKGGYLALTTHAEYLLPASISMPDSGFYYSVGPGTDGLPGFYQTSFQTSDYIRKNWSRHFQVEQIVSRGLAGHQDLVICRK